MRPIRDVAQLVALAKAQTLFAEIVAVKSRAISLMTQFGIRNQVRKEF